VTRAAILWDAAIPPGIGQFAVIQSVAPSFGMEVSPINVRDAGEIERAVAAFARSSDGNSGLIVTASALVFPHRDLIVTLAARHKLPAVYFTRLFVANGGLISYGSDPVDQYRRAASYVDRILKGEKPGDMPVQAPTKYELIINMKTAKTLGLTIPQLILLRADGSSSRCRPVHALCCIDREHPNEHDAHQPASPPHDRGHDSARLRREDAKRLHPSR
jgi:putative tryptophan/tyrosine transport system substrate-binding protein